MHRCTHGRTHGQTDVTVEIVIYIGEVFFKMYSKIINLKLHNHIYKCQLKDNMEILIINKNGKIITSDLSLDSENINNQLFAKKILSFAEIALGKAA